MLFKFDLLDKDGQGNTRHALREIRASGDAMHIPPLKAQFVLDGKRYHCANVEVDYDTNTVVIHGTAV